MHHREDLSASRIASLRRNLKVDHGRGIVPVVVLQQSVLALAFHGSRLLWGRTPSGVEARKRGFAMTLRLGLPLLVVAVLGLWTPGPLATALDSIRAVLGANGG